MPGRGIATLLRPPRFVGKTTTLARRRHLLDCTHERQSVEVVEPFDVDAERVDVRPVAHRAYEVRYCQIDLIAKRDGQRRGPAFRDCSFG